MKKILKQIPAFLLSSAFLILSFPINFIFTTKEDLSLQLTTAQIHSHISPDLLEGTVQSYSASAKTSITASTSPNFYGLDPIDSCLSYYATHGPDRTLGGLNLFDNGCRSYEPHYGDIYGSMDIPYWINMSTINTITNEEHRNILLSDIREQANLWNQVEMHDGSGKFVHLYEVGTNSSSLPANINGRKVVEIKKEEQPQIEDEEVYAGEYDPLLFLIKFNYTNNSTSLRPYRNIDTPLHELGHLLGLGDLDTEYNTPRGTHQTLMGYERGTTEETLPNAIKYQDIQGVATINGIHTEHQFTRYVPSSMGFYDHICFYCDRIDREPEIIEGSLAIQDAEYCNHDYQPMVSSAVTTWLKCTKCYNVIEQGKSFDISYENLTFKNQDALVLDSSNDSMLATRQYTYGTGLDLDPIFGMWQSNGAYVPQLQFQGWYTDSSLAETSKITSISSTTWGDITLYAKWRCDYIYGQNNTVYTITDSGVFNQGSETVNIGLASDNLYQDLKTLGIKYLSLTIKVKLHEKNDGYQHIYLYNGSTSSASVLWQTTIDHRGNSTGTSPSVYTYYIPIAIDDIQNLSSLCIRYSASGSFADTWYRDEIYFEVAYTVNGTSEEARDPNFYWDYHDPFV